MPGRARVALVTWLVLPPLGAARRRRRANGAGLLGSEVAGRPGPESAEAGSVWQT